MYIGLIAKRYATALDEFASANGEERIAYTQAQRLIACYRSESGLREYLFSPVLSVETKLDAVRLCFEQPLCKTLEGFVALVIGHRRERYLYFMLNSFEAIYRRRHNIRDALLTTAAEVDGKVVERIREAVQKKTGGEVHISSRTQPELIGGFVFRLDDVLIDASLAGELDRLKRQLCRKPNRIV